MIYNFEGHIPKIDPDSWVASNAVIIGKVELKKNSNVWFNRNYCCDGQGCDVEII